MGKIYIGSFVKSKSDGKGVGKLTSISDNTKSVEVTYFHSIHEQEKVSYPMSDISEVILQHQTRCYYYIEENDQWVMGRALRLVDQEYEVDFPDRYSMYIAPKDLFVRCDESLPNPTDVLSILGQETAYFHIRRAVFLKTLMEQRAAAKGMTGLISSNITLMAHQVEVIRRVLEDPVPRYLLADEVGLGKTVEAGVILRQMLLDEGERNALILVPAFLLAQWREELDHRCQVWQFPGRVHFAAVETFEVDRYFFPDIVIIDEAHEVSKLAFSKDPAAINRYESIKKICHRAHALLLLSATPVLNNEHEFLSMLHLLDPDNYKLNKLTDFQKKVMFRQDVGKSLLTFREDTKPFLLKRGIANLRTLFENDPILDRMLVQLEDGLNQFSEDERRSLIRRIRVHISETYRLHRRMLRNRRESVGDLLKHTRGEHEIVEQSDIDERTEILHQVLDEYRYEAWASERDLWEEETTTSSTLFQIWLLFLETAGSDEKLFCEIVRSRLNQKVTLRLERVISKKLLDSLTSGHFRGEKDLLERMLKVFEEQSEFGDKIQLLISIMKHLQHKANREGEPPQKIVIFTQYTQVCTDIVNGLHEAFGEGVVGAYHAGLDQEDIEKVTDAFRNDSKMQVLVCDSTGEIGRNFQFADHMIHYDLPLSPNRLEQRIGRLDRLGRVRPFRMTVLTGPDSKVNYQYAWYHLLKNGLGIFQTSISSLQFFVDQHMPLILRNLYIHGLPRLETNTLEICAAIEQEKIKIAEQQIIDEIDARENQATTFFEELVRYESHPLKIQTSVEPWIIGALNFLPQRGIHDGQILYKATERTLVPTLHLKALHKQMDMPGCYDREKSVQLKETKMYRIGEPFFDILSDYLRWDDRGQTYAIWRRVPNWEKGTEDWLGFCLHYIIEGDTTPLKQLLARRGELNKVKAFRRILDKFFEPTYITVYMDFRGQPASIEYINLMEAPFLDVEDGGNDTNITKERLNVIRDTFASKTWRRLCNNCEGKANEKLFTELSFQELCASNAERARVHFKYMKTQMELRNSYESKWGKQETFDEELYSAIIDGIEKPNVHLDSAGFMVLSAKMLKKQKQRGGNGVERMG
ncbi:protein DpdE [Gorillibacterium sp. sgz5001074]|uniref:protein DpdE n=1 Tax=Gorillibacterium sp. sgz5001074 TaxID=3446695 RepID=UPI003F6626C1